MRSSAYYRREETDPPRQVKLELELELGWEGWRRPCLPRLPRLPRLPLAFSKRQAARDPRRRVPQLPTARQPSQT